MQLLDDEALARALGVTMRTLRSWRYEGRDMPPGAKIGGRWKYRESDVEAWFDAKRQATDGGR